MASLKPAQHRPPCWRAAKPKKKAGGEELENCKCHCVLTGTAQLLEALTFSSRLQGDGNGMG